MHFDLDELFEIVIRKAFEVFEISITDEEIEIIQDKLSKDSDFSENVKRCLKWENSAIDNYYWKMKVILIEKVLL